MASVPPSAQPAILVVDDELENLKALERTLRAHFVVHTTDSPKQALEKISTQEYAAIISDQRMPAMSGVELLAKVALISPFTTRVILTAHTETEEMLSAINSAEIYRYITKPWENQELVTILLKAVEHHRLKRENADLLSSLKMKERELRSLNEKLESQVKQRTWELQQANEKLKELAATDELTNLLNRRAFFAKFEEEIIRSARYNRAITVAMIDVDHFKSFNDMEGHVFGDEALRKVARILTRNIRKTDVLCRYGGEEFCLMMPETGTDVGMTICERLRTAVESEQFQGKGRPAYLTISIGISGFRKDGDHTKALIEAADQSLYEAKRNGRNRVVYGGANESFFVS